MLCIAPEELENLLHAQLSGTSLTTTFNGLVSKLTLLFLEGEDSLFDGVGDGDFVNYYVDFLGETMDAVDGLFFDELVYY